VAHHFAGGPGQSLTRSRASHGGQDIIPGPLDSNPSLTEYSNRDFHTTPSRQVSNVLSAHRPAARAQRPLEFDSAVVVAGPGRIVKRMGDFPGPRRTRAGRSRSGPQQDIRVDRPSHSSESARTAPGPWTLRVGVGAGASLTRRATPACTEGEGGEGKDCGGAGGFSPPISPPAPPRSTYFPFTRIQPNTR
jgi:hypothetical protein